MISITHAADFEKYFPGVDLSVPRYIKSSFLKLFHSYVFNSLIMSVSQLLLFFKFWIYSQWAFDCSVCAHQHRWKLYTEHSWFWSAVSEHINSGTLDWILYYHPIIEIKFNTSHHEISINFNLNLWCYDKHSATCILQYPASE